MSTLQHDFFTETKKMPVLFLGHGSPMNAIEENEFTLQWREIAAAIPRPKAVVCISAHWETRGSLVTGMDRPKTIHDFGGFPPELFAKQYPAPGSPDLARTIQEMLRESNTIGFDLNWGLDHGAWSLLCNLYPQADIPVIQLSLDRLKSPAEHYALGKSLAALRRRGILILGSGNIVHNLRLVRWEDIAYDWAMEFDARVKYLINHGDHQTLIDFEHMGTSADLSIPTREHYLPLLYILGLQEAGEPVQYYCEKVSYASLSMRCVQIG
jgi:4,5-DOPA dioxygenase extradiol